MALLERKIDLVLTYGTGQKGDGPPTSVTLSGHRVSVVATIAGGASLGDAQIRVYGLSLSLMNQLSTTGMLPTMFRRNSVTVYAGDDVNGMTMVFQGTTIAAWADMLAAPDVVFNITALAGTYEALLPIAPSSYPNGAAAAVILKNIADQMGVKFENHGVSVILPKSYFPGSARAQAEACVQAARIEWNKIDKGVLAIWPRGGSIGGLISVVSPDTGMVGYPTYTATGIIVVTQFNPTIRFGAQVEVRSMLTPANHVWIVSTLIHDIEALVPGGKWFTQMQLGAIGQVVIA